MLPVGPTSRYRRAAAAAAEEDGVLETNGLALVRVLLDSLPSAVIVDEGCCGACDLPKVLLEKVKHMRQCYWQDEGAGGCHRKTPLFADL